MRSCLRRFTHCISLNCMPNALLAGKRRLCRLALIMSTVVLVSCASSGGDSYSATQRVGGSKIQVCKSGDELVQSSQQCLQDSAACYELSNGQWCTGERGNTCPAGSSEIPVGAACPRGTRCIQFGEGLNCAIQIR